MPTEGQKVSPLRRAFLRGGLFTSEGRARVAAEQAQPGKAALGAVSLDQGRCLAWQRITCLSCRDACPERAIVQYGGLQPNIDAARCTHCAMCVSVCPAGAIRVAAVGIDDPVLSCSDKHER